MKIKPLLWSLFLLQVSLAAWIWQNNSGDDALSLSFLQEQVIPSRAKVGSTFPNLPVFDSEGGRVPLLIDSPDQTILFSTCTCSLADTAELARQAQNRGEKVTIVLQTEPAQLQRYINIHHLSGRVVAVRKPDLLFLRSGKLATGFLLTNGLVTSVLK